MKNLQQIENNLKAQGLAGDQFRWAFQEQALLFGKLMVDDIICGYNDTGFTYEDALVCLAHISEIFVQANFHKFDSDFAEHFQTIIFNSTPEKTQAEIKWNKKLFGDKDLENGVETGAAYPTDESEKPNLQTVADQLSDLMKNPLLPEKLYNVIANEINDIPDVPDIHTPEIVLHNLEILSGGKTNEN